MDSVGPFGHHKFFHQQADPQHLLNAKTLSYGQISGLISFSLALNKTAGLVEQSCLLYSENLNLGTLPEKPEDVFNYEVGNAYHSLRTEWHYALKDTSFIIRKTLAVNKNGKLFERVDSVYEATFQYFYDSTQTWRQYGLSKYSRHIDTAVVDLDLFFYFGTKRTQTAAFSYDSMHNQEYFIAESNSAVSPFTLVVGRELVYADQLTPTPPYAYHAQRHPMIDDIAYSSYYPDGGGPFLRTSRGFDGELETLVYVKDNNGERGEPLSFSFVTTLQKPLSAEIRLYPNPASERVHLQVSESGIWQADIYSLQGQEMGAFSFDGDAYSIDVNHLPGGVYLLHLTHGTHSGSARLLIVRGN